MLINCSRRFAARMRELPASNVRPASLRAANQPFDRQNPPHNRTKNVHYAGEPAGQLAHYALKESHAKA
ncbi:MAG: hypothetical protein ACU84H_15775 [Gammaproteobacteria bacterium]